MKYGLQQSFDIDATTIDAEAFTLGVEWGMAYQRALSSGAFAVVIHQENLERVEGMLRGAGRRFSARTSRGWATITVAGLD